MQNKHKIILVLLLLGAFFFYYFLVPGYLIGQGSPVVAAIWLQIFNTVGLYFIYLSAKALFSPTAGLVAVFLLGFSNHLVSLSRWLSEPSLIFTTVPIMIYSFIQIINAPRHSGLSRIYWPIAALMMGLNLQLEIASEIWFLPAVFLFFLFQKKYWPSVKTLISSVLVFFLTLVPQVLFDFRHDHLMFKAITKHFSDSTNPSFVFSIPKIIDRWRFYQDTFATLLIPQNYLFLTIVLVLVLFVSLTTKKYKTSINFLLIWLLFFPLLVLSFYRGNQGNFYSYYLVGLFPIFIILVSGSISHLFTKKPYFIASVIILLFFALPNFILLKNFLIAGFDGPEHISLGNQLQAIDWVYVQSDNQPFNVDSYVPPVIPYAYDYLFLWLGETKYNRQPDKVLQSLLFTINEVAPPHPERLQAWMDRQSGIGEINKQENFGGIEVQRRVRLQ